LDIAMSYSVCVLSAPYTLTSFSPIHVITPPTIYTLSLHDALPIFLGQTNLKVGIPLRKFDLLPSGFIKSNGSWGQQGIPSSLMVDRKSTRLNSSHVSISYAVFCLKKKTIETRVHATSLYRCSEQHR